jgi:hypothetical protein
VGGWPVVEDLPDDPVDGSTGMPDDQKPTHRTSIPALPPPTPVGFGGAPPAATSPAPASTIKRPAVPQFPDTLGGRLAAKLWHWFPSPREVETAATSWPPQLEGWVSGWLDHHLVTNSREQDFEDFLTYTFDHPGPKGYPLPRSSGNSAAWLNDPDHLWVLNTYRANARREKAAPQPQQPAIAATPRAWVPTVQGRNAFDD